MLGTVEGLSSIHNKISSIHNKIIISPTVYDLNSLVCSLIYLTCSFLFLFQLYRLEDYRACLELYKDLIKNSQVIAENYLLFFFSILCFILSLYSTCYCVFPAGLSLKFQVARRVYTISRRGNVQQGSSFGSIFHFFLIKVGSPQAHSSQGKFPFPRPLETALFQCVCPVFPHMFKIQLVIFGLQDDYGDERETNLAAVISAAAQWGGLEMVINNGHTNAYH